MSLKQQKDDEEEDAMESVVLMIATFEPLTTKRFWIFANNVKKSRNFKTPIKCL